MTEAEQERAAIVKWLERESKRGDLSNGLIWKERLVLAWVALTNAARLYRGTARYWGGCIERGDHLKDK